MTKILCIGDPHFKSNNKEETDLLRKSILSTVQECAPHIIILMGDTLDNGKSIYPPALYDATEFIYDLAKYAKTYVLIGNHDMINNQQFLTPVHPFTGIRNHENLHIVWKLETLSINETSTKYIFLPYVPPGRFYEALGSENMADVTAIFCHQEFKGAALTSTGSKISMTGDVWDSHNPLVISGHIHTYSKLQSNIIYVGSSRQVDFGDITQKTISLFIFNKNGSYSEERIDLNLKIRKIIHLSVFDSYRWEDLDDKNIIWKLYIDGESSEVNRFIRSSKCIWLEKHGVVVFPGNIKQQLVNKLVEHENKQLTSFKDFLQQSIDENQKKWLDIIMKKYNL